MRWLAVLIVLASLRAEAKPRVDFYDDEPYTKPCSRSGDWAKTMRCHHKTTAKLEVIDDRPGTKLIAWQRNPRAPVVQKVLELWFRKDGYWTKSNFYAETNASMEVLGYRPDGDRYRIDLGYASTTWVTLDEVITRPALLKRHYAYVCFPTSYCHTFQVACELLVRGKAVATVRAEPVWEGTAPKLRGDARGANRYCTKPPNFVQVDE